MSRKINVGVVCKENPHDRRPQSGTTFQVFKALERQEGLHVYWIPFNESIWSKTWLNIQKVLKKTFKLSMPLDRSAFYIRLKEKAIDRDLLQKADVLFCPFTQLVSINIPIVYMTDALFQSMINYYWPLDMHSREVRMGNKTQKLVLDHAYKLVLPSQWAINCAKSFYHQPADKIILAEYGPNIDDTDLKPQSFNFDGHLHILFCGIDWKRKGGEIAVDACRWLNDNGIKSTIHIVGPKNLNKSVYSLSFVDYKGFLNKNDIKQYECLQTLIQSCHCMLLPTIAECAGIVFCESSAYGLPSFSHYTGGVPNYIIDGKNGYLLPLGSTGKDFGFKIKECLETGELARMAKSAVVLFQETLNWDSWGRKTAQAIYESFMENKKRQ